MESIKKQLEKLYPNIPEEVIGDIVPLVEGNIKHITEINNSDRPEFHDHAEQIIGFGTGFDWLHVVNKALLLNPLDINSIDPLIVAGQVLKDNYFERKSIPTHEGMTLMVSATYADIGPDKVHAKLKADDLAVMAYGVMKKNHPELIEAGLQFVVGIMDEETRLFTRLSGDDCKGFASCGYMHDEDNAVTKFLMKRNQEQSDLFTESGNVMRRRAYRARHKTEITAFKCMDGRLNLPVMADIPMGIITPYRNVGAKFSMGWVSLYEKVKSWLKYCIKEQKPALILATYHFSNTHEHLGCAGHKYDTEKARQNAFKFACQVNSVFGFGEDNPVNAIVVGINTDNDSLIFHSQDEKSQIDVSKLVTEIRHGEPVVKEVASAAV